MAIVPCVTSQKDEKFVIYDKYVSKEVTVAAVTEIVSENK